MHTIILICISEITTEVERFYISTGHKYYFSRKLPFNTSLGQFKIVSLSVSHLKNIEPVFVINIVSFPPGFHLHYNSAYFSTHRCFKKIHQYFN